MGNGFSLKSKRKSDIMSRKMKEGDYIFTKIIDIIMEDAKSEGKKITKRDFAHAMGLSDSNFGNKYHRDSFRIDEVTEVLDKFGFDLIVRNRETETEYNMKNGERIEKEIAENAENPPEKEKSNAEEIIEMAEKLGLVVVLKNDKGDEFELQSLFKSK